MVTIPRLSQQQQADLDHTRAEEFNINIDSATKIIDSASNALRIIGEEGLYAGFTIDIFLVTGRVGKNSNPILYEQRKSLANLFDKDGFLELMARNLDLAIFKVPNPLRPLVNFIKAYGLNINSKKYDDDKGESYYEALGMPQRLTLALMLPGLMRLLLKFLADILELG